jgi:predicted nucleotidyltransferase
MRAPFSLAQLRHPVPMRDADQEQLARVVALVRDVLGPNVVGAYLFGSAVLGGLQPRSDLDVLAASKRRTTREERQGLVDRLGHTQRDPGARPNLEHRCYRRHPPKDAAAEAGVVRITANEYETALAVAAGRAPSTDQSARRAPRLDRFQS